MGSVEQIQFQAGPGGRSSTLEVVGDDGALSIVIAGEAHGDWLVAKLTQWVRQHFSPPS